MMKVGVQRKGERWAFVDQPHSRMTPAVDSPFMPLRLTKPTLQFQVVLGQIDHWAHKQPGLEAGHDLRQMLVDRTGLLRETPLEALKSTAAGLLQSVRRIQRVGN